MLTTTSAAATASYRRDLGDGLILRWSTAEDTARIAHLTSLVFRDKADEPPNEFMIAWIHRLMRGNHPNMGPGDYGVIEDTSKEDHPIVACTCLWRHEWTYEGIPFGIGRPEIVASDPAYRNRGLIRALFEMVHARSESEGHLVQAITGIPYFYRQFGYEYALDLDGRRTTYLSLIPELKEGEAEPYTLREATVEDIPFLMDCYHRRRSENIVWTSIPESYWRYWLEGWKANPDKDREDVIHIIIDATGTGKGFLATQYTRRRKNLVVWSFEIASDSNLQAMMPSVLRALHAYGLQMPVRTPDTKSLQGISFHLGRSHPVYDVLGDELAPSSERPYAWYVRVPDLAAFIKHIAAALEQRLANSPIAGYTGELKLDFYRGGFRIIFDSGKLVTAEPWVLPVYDSNAGAGIPALLFLQLLFGYRGLDDLCAIFPDVWADNDARVVLKTLFPARSSYVLSL